MTAWDDQLLSSFTLTSGVTATSILTENVADPEKRGCTIQRVIVGLDFSPNLPNAVNGASTISMGIGLTSDDAFAAAALPDPEVDADFPVSGWLYRNRVLITDTVTGGNWRSIRVDQDLRVARKMDRSTVFMSFRAEQMSGAAFNVHVSGLIRVLYKLP